MQEMDETNPSAGHIFHCLDSPKKIPFKAGNIKRSASMDEM